MAGTPNLLTETPNIGSSPPATDVLSDLLRVVRLTGSIFWKAEFGAPFAVRADGRPPLEPGQVVTRHHGTIFHLITEGQCWLDVPGHDRMFLGRGDVMLLPFGDRHLFGSGEAEPVAADDITQDRKSTRLNSSHIQKSRMPSSA